MTKIVSDYLHALYALVFQPDLNNFEIFQVLVKFHNFSKFLEFGRFLSAYITFHS